MDNISWYLKRESLLQRQFIFKLKRNLKASQNRNNHSLCGELKTPLKKLVAKTPKST